MKQTNDKTHSHFVAIFETKGAAQAAVDRLTMAGLPSNQLSLLVSDKSAKGHFGFDERKLVPEGAAVGGAVGLGLGALVGALVAVGSIAIPGIGLIAAGPLVAALAGAGVVGASGGLVGGLIGLGFSEAEAKFFEDEVRGGGILLAVEYTNEAEKATAKRVLDECEAKRVAA